MMAATTASSTLGTAPSGSAAGDAIASNSQGSGAQNFGQSFEQLESEASKQEVRLTNLATAKDLKILVSEEEVNEEGFLSQTGLSMLLSEQGIREGGVLPTLNSMQTMQQKTLADSQLNETTALKSQSAVSAVDLSGGKSPRAAVAVNESQSQLAAMKTSLSQKESVSPAVSELLSRHKVQVTQDTKSSVMNEMTQFRGASQELNFKAELAMSSSTKAEIGQRLVSMLSDKITLQASSQANKATIRLDPPELGKIDLTVTLDRDRLSIQINSTNASVREAITQTVERLRAELVQENFLEVTVNVGNDDKSGSSQHDNVQDDALTHIASNLSVEEQQTEESNEQQQEIIARV